MQKPERGITGIYKITSPSGKVYVGQSKNILSRWYKYSKMNCEKQTVLYRSLKKYGFENHSFDILETCGVSELHDREIFYKEMLIRELGKENILFCNINDGNSGPHMQTLSSNIKRSNSIKKHYQTHQHPLKGTKKEIKDIEKYFKPVIQYSLKGEFIKEWSSQLEVYDKLNIQINNCLRKRYKTAGGFQWEYKKDDIDLYIESVGKKINRTEKHCNNISIGKIGKGLKPIFQLDLEGNFIKKWNSQSEASNSTKISIGNINLCLKGHNKTSGGFKWVYDIQN